MSTSNADLCHALAALCEEYGQVAVLGAMRDACRGAADHETGTPSAERFTKAGDAIQWALDDVAHASASGSVTLDMALTVLSDQ